MKSASLENKAHFRFYEELNDFLPADQVKQAIAYQFDGNPGIKDAIEALGVPHAEVDLIVVNGESVGFDYHLRDGDRVAVYPVFESIDISPAEKLRPQPLRVSRFILDVHLGTLARRLRMLGFDTSYRNDYEDREIVTTAARQGRIILTRDRALLYHNIVTRGYWVRSTDPDEQVREVVARFDLVTQFKPFSRCIACNGEMETVEKSEIEHRLEPKTRRYFDEFKRCRDCGRIYWKGTHYERLSALVADIRAQRATDGH